MSEKELLKHLSGLPLGAVRYYDSVGSTNDIALAWAAEGAPDFSLIVADEQTAGRGRMGRKWFTPGGSALAFSLILRPSVVEREQIAFFSGLGALALVDSLRDFGVTAKIKWPNDVLISGKKTAGILVETVWMGSEVESIVLGMGVNVTPESVPPVELLNFPATCIWAEMPHDIGRFDLLHALVISLIKWRPRVNGEAFTRAWDENLAFRGEEVQVWTSEKEYITGLVDGIEADGSLRLDLPSGEKRGIRFGEVHLRPV